MTRLLATLGLGSITVLMLALSIGLDARTQAATPAGGPVQGDVNCVGGVTGVDALNILTYAAGIMAAAPAGGCPHIGVAVIGGELWGDVTCDGLVDAGDVGPVLRAPAGLSLEHFDDCVDVGQQIGGPTASPSPTPGPTASPSPTPFACPGVGWTVGAGSATWDCQASDRVELHVDDGEHMLLRSETFTDTHIEADVSTTNREAGLVVRAQNGQNAYVAVLIPHGTPFLEGVQFYKVVGGAYNLLQAAPFSTVVNLGDTAHFEVDIVGTHVTVKVNGDTLIDLNDGTYASGKVGLRAFADPVAPCDTIWDNIAFSEVP